MCFSSRSLKNFSVAKAFSKDITCSAFEASDAFIFIKVKRVYTAPTVVIIVATPLTITAVSLTSTDSIIISK